MDHITLYELIDLIERGTNLHISMAFLGNHGSDMCDLPHSHTIHSRPICEIFKSTHSGLRRCMKCREYAIKRAIKDKAPFSALCINGVYEYTHPITRSGEVVAIIFIGNILTDEGERKLAVSHNYENLPLDTMERGLSENDLKKIASLVEDYTLYLLDRYPKKESSAGAVIENIKSYVKANLEYDHTLSGMASLLFYNEAYLGRMFYKETGESFKDFLNRERVERAKELLSDDLTVTEVARRVGYNSVTYFNRVFKATTGMTPTEFISMRK